MTNVHGISVSGGSFPAEIWRRFMEPALAGRPSGTSPSRRQPVSFHDLGARPTALSYDPYYTPPAPPEPEEEEPAQPVTTSPRRPGRSRAAAGSSGDERYGQPAGSSPAQPLDRSRVIERSAPSRPEPPPSVWSPSRRASRGGTARPSCRRRRCSPTRGRRGRSSVLLVGAFVAYLAGLVAVRRGIADARGRSRSAWRSSSSRSRRRCSSRPTRGRTGATAGSRARAAATRTSIRRRTFRRAPPAATSAPTGATRRRSTARRSPCSRSPWRSSPAPRPTPRRGSSRRSRRPRCSWPPSRSRASQRTAGARGGVRRLEPGARDPPRRRRAQRRARRRARRVGRRAGGAPPEPARRRRVGARVVRQVGPARVPRARRPRRARSRGRPGGLGGGRGDRRRRRAVATWRYGLDWLRVLGRSRTTRSSRRATRFRRGSSSSGSRTASPSASRSAAAAAGLAVARAGRLARRSRGSAAPRASCSRRRPTSPSGTSRGPCRSPPADEDRVARVAALALTAYLLPQTIPPPRPPPPPSSG